MARRGCVRLCIWMPIHRPDEIACRVSIIISGNDDILKSCNTYTINFTILWNEALFFSFSFGRSPAPTSVSDNPKIRFVGGGGRATHPSCYVTMSNSFHLCFQGGDPGTTWAWAGGFKKRGGMWVKRISKTQFTSPHPWKTSITRA